MENNRVYTLGSAKKLVKYLKKNAKEEWIRSNYQMALLYYKRANDTAFKWNLTKEKQRLAAEILKINTLILKMEFDKHLEAAKKYEVNKELTLALDHIKAASLIASELKNNGAAEINELLNNIAEKMKYFEFFRSKQIIMTVNDGNLYKTPVILSKALQCIDTLPPSFQLEDNFIEFQNYKRQKLYLKRISPDSWYLEIKSSEKPIKTFNYKYLTTTILNVIILNFIKGYFIGDLLFTYESKNKQYQEFIKIINRIRTFLEYYNLCECCNKKILKLGQDTCEYCESKLDYDKYIFTNLLDESFKS